MTATTRPSRLERFLIVAIGVLAALAVVAGHVNRELLDGPTFAEHVDEVRRDDAVSEILGRSITRQLLRAQPDLVAIRPLVEDVAVRVAGGDLLSGPTRAAARAAHAQLTSHDPDSIVLRITDAGAVVTAVLAAATPDRVSGASDVSVTLATFGEEPCAPALIELTQAAGTLAWLLPFLAAACFGVALVRSSRRWDTTAAMGRSLAWAAAGIGVLLLIGGFLVRRLDDEQLTGALIRTGWSSAIRPLWWGVALLAAAGLTVAHTCRPVGSVTMDGLWRSLRGVALVRPTRPATVVARAVVAAVVGVAVVLDPLGVLEPLIVVAGVGLVVFAAAELAELAARGRVIGPEVSADRPDASRARPIVAIAIGVLAAATLGLGALAQARPGDDVEVAAGDDVRDVCNGHAELCDRPFDGVAFVTSHNAMAVSGAPGWYLGEQLDPIPTQLDQGVRALMLDVWSGRPAGATVVRTAAGSYEEALAVAGAEVGPDVVEAALRVADSIAGPAQGPEDRYLCHGLCETGSTSFADTLDELRAWLLLNPSEVVTLLIENHVAAERIAADIEAAGLLPFVYEPQAGATWPTLRDMITSGRRLVVMVEAGDGGDAAPWLVNGFEFMQDTPYTFPTVASFSCDPNRGPDDASLFLVNHWLADFSSLVSSARTVNASDVLLPRVEECREERGLLPNFVAVNFVAIGDVGAVVDILNGVG